MKKDNKGLRDKLILRRQALAAGPATPLILDAYAGRGVIFDILYRDAPPGAALERNEEKAASLARQRPAWRVYECDSVAALAAGLLADMTFTFLDADPYGECWPLLDAFFGSDRAFAPAMTLAVNCGLRRMIKMGTAWKVHSLHEAVERWGPDLHDQYLAVCRWLVEKKAGEALYDLTRFEGFYAGHAAQMTHFYAVLEKRPADV